MKASPTPSTSERRSFISSAAMFVKVIATMLHGGTPSSKRNLILSVSTLVLPEPAPATTKMLLSLA